MDLDYEKAQQALKHERDRHDNKMGVAICTIIAGCIITVVLIVMGTIWLAGAVTAGPKEDARARVYSKCATRFSMGVYDEPCLTLLTEEPQ